MENKSVITPGLEKLAYDKRDLSLGGIFGFAKLTDVPDIDWIVKEPLKMKNQLDKDFCTGYTVTEVSEDQEGVELSPDFQYAASCRIRGDYTKWGMDLRIAFKSAVEYGSLAVSDVPFLTDDKTRDFLANPVNWPLECWEKATAYKKQTFYAADGPYDIFDNIRSNLWKYKEEHRTIGVGAKWRNSWISAPNGVVPDVYEDDGFGHAFKIFGQKMINGEPHLIAQLSNGDIGDNGIYYFKRSVVNREFGDYGQFMYQDLPKNTAVFYQKHNIKVSDSFFSKIVKVITSILNPKYYL